MKARVKATGEIVEISESSTIYDAGMCHIYNASELENIPDTNPDYWTCLEHHYAGMAMQAMSENFFKEYRDYCAGFGEMDIDEAKATMKDFADAMADICYYFAHALVEKYKKEE